MARPAQVRQVSKAYLYAHHQLLDEFRNATHWPKHLLVQYAWQVEQEVDALSGLYVVFAVCEPRRPPQLPAPHAIVAAPVDAVHTAGAGADASLCDHISLRTAEVV